jgi:hypothetical protein
MTTYHCFLMRCNDGGCIPTLGGCVERKPKKIWG